MDSKFYLKKNVNNLLNKTIFLDPELNETNNVSILKRIKENVLAIFSKILNFLNFHLQPLMLKHFLLVHCIRLKF